MENRIMKIKEYMNNRGFFNTDDGYGDVNKENFRNEDTGVLVEDLHLGNVIEGEDGNLFVFDPIIYLDSEERGFGGNRKPNQNTEINLSSEPKASSPISEQNKNYLDNIINDIESGNTTLESEVKKLEDGLPKRFEDKYIKYLNDNYTPKQENQKEDSLNEKDKKKEEEGEDKEFEFQQSRPPWMRSEIRRLDDLAFKAISLAGFSPSSIPEPGVLVPLRRIESTAWGGVDEEVTQIIHKDNLFAALYASKLLGLNVAGIDIISPDISEPWHKNGAIINEVICFRQHKAIKITLYRNNYITI
jgi:hypothetical protein